MNSAGNVPAPNPGAPVRSETWTDNLGRMGEERLAHVKELIEVGLGQRTPHFGQSNISLRHFDDHLVITWEADGNYGKAWTAWSDPDVKAARKAMLEKTHQAAAADDKLRTAQANEYSARATRSRGEKSKEVEQAKKKSKEARNDYYKAQHDFEVEYETKYNAAPGSQKRLTFELWLVYNINGGLPQNVAPLIANEFRDLPKQPVNHFLRVQRSNYPHGPSAGSPAMVLPPYPTDAAAANAILEDIFLPKPRTHASQIEPILIICAKSLFWVVVGLSVVLAILAAYVLYLIWDAQQRRDTELTVLDAINSTIEKLERLVGQEGQDINGLEQAKDALDVTVRDVEGKINALNDEIRGLNENLTLTFKRQGLDAPPCWGVGLPPDRRVRYLFKIELRENDAKPIRVVRIPIKSNEPIARGPFADTTIGDNYSSSFENPAAGFPLGDWMSAADFSTRIAGPVNNVYAAQDAANSCRHYVRLCDHSYQDKNAASYKALLASIEGTFYYYRPSPSSCGPALPRGEAK